MHLPHHVHTTRGAIGTASSAPAGSVSQHGVQLSEKERLAFMETCQTWVDTMKSIWAETEQRGQRHAAWLADRDR